MARSEQPHLFVDRKSRGCNRRAQDDERGRCIERSNSRIGQVVAPGKILAVAKDRPQCFRHRPRRRLATDQIFVDAIAFQRRMQPLDPLGIVMAVAQECAVFDGKARRDNLNAE